MKLGAIVGTTTAPADPATIPAAAQKLFEQAVASTTCATPLIALNELNGASTTTPWTTTNAQYRSNVLELLRQLTSRGARPFLLVSSAPYTGGEAADWWRQAAQAADLVPEVYFNAPAVMKQGVILGSRRMRTVAPLGDRRVHRDRDPGGEARLRARLPVGPGRGRARGIAAVERLVRVRQALHAGRDSGSPPSSASPRSGAGGGGPSTPPAPTRTSRRPRASTSGRATRTSATGRRPPARASSRRSPRARSTCRRECSAPSTGGRCARPTSPG